ncbi:MAG: GNAT family N-acetyltransferase [Dongiaceae bacterium]
MTADRDDKSLWVGMVVANAEPTRPPERKPFAGRFVSLEPIDPGRHAGQLYACSHGTPEIEQLWTYMSYGPFESVAAMRSLLEKQAAASDPIFFAVIDNTGRTAVGVVSYLNCVPSMRSIELGHIWYAPSVQRTKTNTEAMYLMMCRAFDELGYRRVEWKCNALNERSRQAARRLGFEFEGLFRQHMIIKRRNRDTAWYAMLDRDWPAIKRNMEQWLYAGTGDRAMSLAELNAKR